MKSTLEIDLTQKGNLRCPCDQKKQHVYLFTQQGLLSVNYVPGSLRCLDTVPGSE